MNPIISAINGSFASEECLICNERLQKGERGLCSRCFAELPRTDFLNDDNMATRRVFGMMPFVHGAAFFVYHSGSGHFSRQLVNAKYSDRVWVNHCLATRFAHELSASGWPFDIDVILPVPIHPLRRLFRGYNQTEPIATAVSEVWGIPVECDNLVKTQYTHSLVSRNDEERRRAFVNSFSLRHPERLANRHVLIVDDVLSTGATLSACAHHLAPINARFSFLALGLSG